jgi:diguanylate cyclase (GGDEF)-like protein/PAS domain S-box-containing protein
MTSKLLARPWVDRCLMASLIAGSAWLSLALAKGPGGLSAIWVGNGIFAGWLLSRPTQAWPAYVAFGLFANITARLLVGSPLSYGFLIAVCHVLEVLAIAGAIRRQVPEIGDPKRWIALGGVATGSTLIACGLAGVLAAAITHGFYHTPFWISFVSWYAAHVVGMVVIGTTTLVVHREGIRAIAPSGRRLRFALSMALVAASAAAVFLSDYPLLFLVYPPLLLGAFQHRFPGVVVGVALLTVVGGVATSAGHGPLWLAPGVSDLGRAALFQLYISGGCLLTIPVVLVMTERRKLNSQVRHSEHQYRLLADYSSDLIVRLNSAGERVYVSPSAEEMLGWRPADMLGPHQNLIHPRDLDEQRLAMDQALIDGQSHTSRYRVRHRDGYYIWMEVVMRPVPSENQPGKHDLILAGRNITRRMAAEAALETSRRELERLSRVDALTGIANRRQLEERLPLALARLERSGYPVALMYLDIDHFKHINDTHGHAAGDKVIQAFAGRIGAMIRVTDLLVRLGGDEFVIVLEDANRPTVAEVMAMKILTAMRTPIDIGMASITVTTSIGIAFASKQVVAEDMMVAADEALYAAKEAGRNQYRMELLGPDPASVEP